MHFRYESSNLVQNRCAWVLLFFKIAIDLIETSVGFFIDVLYNEWENYEVCEVESVRALTLNQPLRRIGGVKS